MLGGGVPYFVFSNVRTYEFQATCTLLFGQAYGLARTMGMGLLEFRLGYRRNQTPRRPSPPTHDSAIFFFFPPPAQAFDAARLEEEYNVERWGMIEGGHDMDRGNTTLTLTAASTLIWLRGASLPTPSPQ